MLYDPCTSGSAFYSYVGNDPTDKTDPSGLEVRPDYVNGGTEQDYTASLNYLANSSVFGDDFMTAVRSPLLFVVRVDPRASETIYKGELRPRTIIYNPRLALRLRNGDIQSPALGLGHEFDHVAEDIRDHAGFVKGSERKPIGGRTVMRDGIETVEGVFREAPEEVRATNRENEMARQLGDATRSSHTEGVPVQVPSPTYHCVHVNGKLQCSK